MKEMMGGKKDLIQVGLMPDEGESKKINGGISTYNFLCGYIDIREHADLHISITNEMIFKS